MEPVLPFSSGKVKKMLNVEGDLKWDDAGKKELPAGNNLGPAEILFTKIEDDVIQKEIDKLKRIESNTQDRKTADDGTIDFDTFQKIELKTAKVIEAEKVEGADKLLRLQIDLGSEKRQIVAGVAQSYSPEEMIGKTLIVVANLKPAVIRGVESKGMLLAVKTDKGHAVLTTEEDVKPGIRVS
jgi:methionyl-tRNA synthetase